MLRVIRLNNFERINEYGVHWNDLLDSSKDNHIFMTLEWLATWWKYYGNNRRLVLLIVEDNKKVLAVAPLMETTYTLFGFKLTNIEFVGTPSSDYHTFILVGKNLMCTKALLTYIKEHLTAWDCVELKNVPKHTETANILRSLARDPLNLKESVLDLCPYVPLPSTFEEYRRNLGRSSRKKLGQFERRLKRKHKVEIREYDEMGSVEEAMKTFFYLHQKRWQAKGAPGLFADRVFRDFHLEVAKRFAERGWLRLLFLTVDEEAVSAEYSFSYRNKVYAYLCGFDPRYSDYSVGNLSTGHLIRTCIEDGLAEFDLMRGGHPHKIHWNAKIRENVEFVATRWRPTPKAYEWLVRSNVMPSLSSWLRKRALSKV